MNSTLYLHCGVHKTGSSFLQTMFVRNRELLHSGGIHYPKSEKELDMTRGEITPGNGIELARTILEKESDIVNILSRDLQEAGNLGLNSVFYSSEVLFHNFAEHEAVNKLYNASKKAGYDKIVALIYFRDPVSHALSTYKHRAKNGGHADFSIWIRNHYETWNLIHSFLEYSKTVPIEWTCRKYSSESEHMVESSFKEWLNLPSPEIPADDRVNRSLNLNEIRVLQLLKNEYDGCEDYIRDAMLSVPATKKMSNKCYESEYRSRATDYLKNHQDQIDELNLLMKEVEQLSINLQDDTTDSEAAGISLSESQILAIATGMKNFADSKILSCKMRNYWNRGVDKVKRKWAASRLSYKLTK